MNRCVGVLVVFALSTPAAAQGTSTFFARTTLSGYVDPYYAYNFNHPATPCKVVNGVAVFNCLHAFDVARNSFSLNLAALAVEKVPTGDSRGGFRIDLGYGSGAALIAGAETSRLSLSQNVLQAYASYLAAANGRLQFDVGKFVTSAGIERIDPAGNWNASRSLLFALAIPRDDVGLRAVYTPNGTIAVTGVLSNGWSDVTENRRGKTRRRLGVCSTGPQPDGDGNVHRRFGNEHRHRGLARPLRHGRHRPADEPAQSRVQR